MAVKDKKKVNRMIGKVPLVGNLTPVQCVNAFIAFLVAYIVHANFNDFIVAIAVWLWCFFTLTLVLGSNHWSFLNKFRRVPKLIDLRELYSAWYTNNEAELTQKTKKKFRRNAR